MSMTKIKKTSRSVGTRRILPGPGRYFEGQYIKDEAPTIFYHSCRVPQRHERLTQAVDLIAIESCMLASHMAGTNGIWGTGICWKMRFSDSSVDTGIS